MVRRCSSGNSRAARAHTGRSFTGDRNGPAFSLCVQAAVLASTVCMISRIM
jgi:hypothetical protein